MADLAKYVVALEAQTAKYEAQLNRANKKLASFDKRQRKTLDTIRAGFAALGGLAAVRGLSRFVKSSIDAADRANKFSQQVGVSTETITGLELAAKLAGVTMRDVEVGMRRFGRAISDANAGLSTQLRAFKDLDVAFANSDGSMRSVDDALRDVADRFAVMEDGARKVARAQELFGRSGSLLIPMLNKGADGINEVIKVSRDLNLVWTQEAAAAAEDFNDRLALLGAVVQGAGNALAKEMLPGLNSTTAALIIFNEEGAKAATVGGLLASSIKGLTSVFISAQAGISALGERIGAYSAALSFLLKGDVDSATAVAREFGAKYSEIEERLQKSMDALFADPGSDADKAAQDVLARLQAVVSAMDDIKAGSLGSAASQIFEGEGAAAAENEGRIAANAYAKAFTADNTLSDAYAAALQKGNDQSAVDLANQYAAALSDTSVAENVAKSKDAFVDLFGDNMVQAANNGFDSILQSWARTLQQMLAKAAASKIFDLLSASSGGGGFFGSVVKAFGGARADGGPVSSGKSYLVGEQGPELFMPSSSGHIVPNGGGGGLTINVDAPNSDVGMIPRIEAAVARAVAISEQKRIEAKRRGA